MRTTELSPSSPLTATLARCGHQTLPGQVARLGDAAKHLGPPESLGIPTWSRFFQTRCGLTDSFSSGSFFYTHDDDDVWCPDCLKQAGIRGIF